MSAKDSTKKTPRPSLTMVRRLLKETQFDPRKLPYSIITDCANPEYYTIEAIRCLREAQAVTGKSVQWVMHMIHAARYIVCALMAKKCGS